LAEKYRKILLTQENDSLAYFTSRSIEMVYFGKFKESLEIYKQKIEDSTNVYRFIQTAYVNMLDRNFEEMNRNFDLFRKEAAMKKIELSGGFCGYMLLRTGNIAESNIIFEKLVKEIQANLKISLVYSLNGGYDYDLATIFSAWGKAEKAVEHLRNLKKFEGIPVWMVSFLESPMFDNIREMPEFKALHKEFEARYQREREKTRKILLKEGFNV
jgi:tetratricopeptide (TPR) repeat protein